MEIEYYNRSNQPVKMPWKLRVRKQVAVACLAAYAFLIVNFIMGVYSNPVLADLHKISLSTSKGNEFDVHTSSGNFRCTAREIENFEGATQINLWKTPYYKTIIKAQIIKPNEEAFWCPVNIYIIFSFFPILGIIGGVLALTVKGDWAMQYGFQLSIFSVIMLVFSCLMLGMI